MTTKQWRSALASAVGPDSAPSLQIAQILPGETVIRTQIYINSSALSPDPYTYAAVALPVALVTSVSDDTPDYEPYTSWGTTEDLQVMWQGLLVLNNSPVAPGSPVSYASWTTGTGVEGYTSHAQRTNRTTDNAWIWLCAQLDTRVTVGDVFTTMGARCLVATPG